MSGVYSESLSVRPQPGNSNVWFEGSQLLPLLRKVLSLPDGPETDLLQYLDRSGHNKHPIYRFFLSPLSTSLKTIPACIGARGTVTVHVTSVSQCTDA